MTADATAAFADAWYRAWNARDLDAILAHYAEDVVFTSPVVRRRLAEPTGTLRGKSALRAYFEGALAAYPDLRFEPLATLAGVGSVALHYRGVGGTLVAEVMVLDASGLVREARVHYAKA